MDSLYLILLALFLLVIIPRIMQRRRLAAIRHILNRKMRNKENIEMKELAKRFIGEECIIYTITSNDGSVQGLIKEIDDGGMVIEKKTGELEIIWISSPVFGSIRERKTGRKRTSYWTKINEPAEIALYSTRKMRFAACGQHIRCLRGRVFTENALYFSSEVHKADSL